MSGSFIIINSSKSWKKGDHPMPPMVQLALGSHGSDGNNMHYLTQLLASDEEIDEAFDRLKKNLEVDSAAAKRVLKIEKERMRKANGNGDLI